MTDEHLRRTMEFIVEQQAQMAAHLQQLEEERIRDRPRMARLEQSFLELVELNKTVDSRLDRLESASDRLESTSSRLEFDTKRLEFDSKRLENSLAVFIEKSDSRLTRLESTSEVLGANMATLAISQVRANERMTALIEIVREERGNTS